MNQITPYIRNAIDLNRFSNKLGNDVVQVYVDAAQQLLRDFAAQDGTTETRMARLNAQALQIRDTIASAYADKYPDLIKQLTELANQQAKFQAKTLKKQIPKGVGVNVRTVEVSKDYVEALAKGDPKAKLKLSGDEIIRRSLPRILPDDQPALKKVIEDLADSSSKTLEKSLRSGLLLGKTNDEIVRGLLAGNKIPKGSPLKKTESAVRTVVQSAVIGVGAEAQLLTIEANKDITDEYEFLATLDNRTSPQCVLAETDVLPLGHLEGGFKRVYSGEIVVITTATGKQLKTTPNHPILSSRGWRSAKEIEPTKDVIYSIGTDIGNAATDKDVRVPTPAAKLFDSLLKTSRFDSVWVRPTAIDFHGDGIVGKEKIHTLKPKRLLRLSRNFGFLQQIIKSFFGFCHDAVFLLGNSSSQQSINVRSPFAQPSQLNLRSFKTSIKPAFRTIAGQLSKNFRWANSRLEQGDRHMLIGLDKGISLTSFEMWHSPEFLEQISHCRGGSSVLFPDFDSGHPFSIVAEDVVSVDFELSNQCHVYNFESQSGVYLASSIIVHNCRALDGKVFKVNDPTAPRPPIHYRCRSTLIPSLSKFFKDNNIELDTGTRASMDGQVPADLNYEQWLKTQTPAFQDEVLGKGKANLFRKGMGLAQMVREDGTIKNLKDLETEPIIPPLPPNLGGLSLAELKDLAAKRGLSIDDVKALGSTRAKKTWVNALQGNTADPKPIVTESATFPPDLSRLEKVKDLGGSTGAELVRDPDTGKLFVRKSGSSPEHLREEFYADQAYRALGIPVPDGRLYEVNGKPVKLTEFIEGKPLSAFHGKERDAIYQKLQQHFVADAILGNWDVVGLAADNILVDKDGTPYRIDNGGALRFRAQGQQKKGAWNDYPTEIFSLRDPSVNAMSANVFGGLKYQNLLSQLEQLEQDKSTLLNTLPPQLQSVIARRIDEGGRVARVGRTLIADKFNAEYTENFTKHSLGYRANGMVDKMPQRIELAEGNKFIDQDGKPFDNLRGKGSIVADLEKYVDSIGGNYKIISDWMDSQSDSSWSEQSLAFKYMIAKVRNNDGDYIWLDKKEEAKKLYKELSRNNNKYEETFAAYHAFSYELLQKTAMPNNDQSRNTFTVYRTESKYVMQDLNGLSVGDRGVTMRRGAAESSSAFTPISAIAGKELTIQQVPHHRIVGTYLQSRTSRGDSAFLGDKENEFVFIPDGIEFDYVSSGNLRDYAVQPTATINKAKPTKKTQSSSDDTDILYKVGVLPQELFDEILDKYGGVSGVLNNAAKIEKEYHL